MPRLTSPVSTASEWSSNEPWTPPSYEPERWYRLGRFFRGPRGRPLAVAVALLVGVGFFGIAAFVLVSLDDQSAGLETSGSDTAAPDSSLGGIDRELSLTASPDGASDLGLVTSDPLAPSDTASSPSTAGPSQPPTSIGPPTTSSAAPGGVSPTTASAPTTASTVEVSTTVTSTTTAPATSSTATPSTAPSTTATTAPATTAPGGGGDAEVQQQILNLVNVERASEGCGALTLHSILNTSADEHSEDMAVNDYFSHTGLDGSQPWDRAQAAGYSSSFIGENIAQGYGSAESVMNGWMNSSGHRANILNCSYEHLGVGYSPGNGSRSHYWTQVFGGGG